MSDDTPDVDVHGPDELEGVSYFGKPVLECDRDELRSVIAHLIDENKRLKEEVRSAQRRAQVFNGGHR